jgi:hypothetical protein
MAHKDASQALQDLVVDSMRRSQEAVVDIVRSWRAQWDSQPLAQPFGALSVPPLITLEQVDAAFDVAERMLAEQRRLTKDLLSAAMPALTAASSPRPVTAKGATGGDR